jgi:hypothetical protein
MDLDDAVDKAADALPVTESNYHNMIPLPPFESFRNDWVRFCEFLTAELRNFTFIPSARSINFVCK